MFIHLGEDTVINDKEIIGVFDIDTSTVNKATRDYLSKAEKDKRVVFGMGAMIWIIKNMRNCNMKRSRVY